MTLLGMFLGHLLCRFLDRPKEPVEEPVKELELELDSGKDRLGLFVARKPDEVLRAAEAAAERLRAGQRLIDAHNYAGETFAEEDLQYRGRYGARTPKLN